MYAIKNVTIFDGATLQEHKTVLIAQGKIVDIVDTFSTFEHKVPEEINGEGNILAPGFIDIQVNGGGGAFFNENPSVEVLKTISAAHLQFGTTSFLPTFISDSFENTKIALNAVKTALNQAMPGILGIHLEGPYLNLEKKGIHNKQYIRAPLANEIDELCNFNIPIKLVTLAPEVVPKIFIDQLYKNNFIIFAGHSNATFEQMDEAFNSGVSGITHFFNACSQFLSREPGVVGAGLFHDDIWCGLIADGKHVSFNAIKIALKAKGKDRFILVSDAMAPVGTNLSEFYVHEQKIFVKDHHTKYEDSNGTLAGSSLTIHQALKNMVLQNCAPLSCILAMTSTNPAKCLQLDHVKGKIQPAYDADLVLLNKENLNIMKVIQAGVIIK